MHPEEYAVQPDSPWLDGTNVWMMHVILREEVSSFIILAQQSCVISIVKKI